MNSVIDHPPPPMIERSPGGGDGGWIRLFRAASDIEAHLLAGRLNAAGVETRAIKDRSGGDAWLHNGSNPWSPVDLFVRRHHLDDARIVLAEIAFDQPVTAPRPDGTDGRDWRVPVAWWATAVALALAFTGISLLRTADHLDRCGLTSDCRPSTVGP